MKTHIDYEKMDTINHLDDAINALRNAGWIYLSTPSDFSMASTLQEKMESLREANRELVKVREWLRMSKSAYQRSEIELNYNLARIDNVEIKPYVSKING